jgi:hypothetical protein
MRTPRFRRPRLSYANVTATLALVIATSMGGAYAHGKIGSEDIKKNAVKSRHIAAKNVKTPDLAKNAVTTNRIKAKAVTRGKLAPNARPNVVVYLDPDGHDFTADSSTAIVIPGLTADVAANSAWIVEGRNSAGSWVPIPGGDNGASGYVVRVFPVSQTVFIVNTSGPGEEFFGLKVVRIPGDINGGPVVSNRARSTGGR